MPPTRMSLADDFGLELELAPDYVVARIDDVPNTVAMENRRRSRRYVALLEDAGALTDPPKQKKGEKAETDEEADARLGKADDVYAQARDVLLEIAASQLTDPTGSTPSLDDLRDRLPTLAHAIWLSNALSNEANLDPTRRTTTS